jgi:hypothetical protein
MGRAGIDPRDTKTCTCGTEIVFLTTHNGAKMPVNVLPTDAKFRGPTAGETQFVHGEHQPHWVDCPDAEDFRGR